MQVQPAAAPKAGGAWAKPGELAQRLGSREQPDSRSASANSSQGSTPTSQVLLYPNSQLLVLHMHSYVALPGLLSFDICVNIISHHLC